MVSGSCHDKRIRPLKGFRLGGVGHRCCQKKEHERYTKGTRKDAPSSFEQQGWYDTFVVQLQALGFNVDGIWKLARSLCYKFQPPLLQNFHHRPCFVLEIEFASSSCTVTAREAAQVAARSAAETLRFPNGMQSVCVHAYVRVCVCACACASVCTYVLTCVYTCAYISRPTIIRTLRINVYM